MTRASDSTKWQEGDGDFTQEQADLAEVEDDSASHPGSDFHAPYELPVEYSHSNFSRYRQQNAEVDYSTVPRSHIGPGSDVHSSFESEYDFALQATVENSTQNFEIDEHNARQFINLEDNLAARVSYELDFTLRGFDRNPQVNFGSGHHTAQSRSASNVLDFDEFEPAAEGRSRPQLGFAPQTPDPAVIPSPDPRVETNTPVSGVSGNSPDPRPKVHLCNLCSGAFRRAGDLRRHYKVHFPDSRTFHCRIEGCNRNGRRGFYRRDKLRDHQKKAHLWR